MQTDPYRAPRTRPRRVSLIAASFGAAAAVSTGAFAYSVATHDPTSATTASDGSTTGSSLGSSSSLPQSSTSSSAHASSGGS